MEEAERLCDRIAIIDNGRIIALGTKEELVKKTLGGRQAVTVEAASPISPAFSEKLRRLSAAVDGTKVKVSVEDAAAGVRDLLGLFDAEKVGVRDLTLKSPTLEQVFLRLTGRELRE
jgi:ABC-2 type transport system ATP-binding protein